MGKAHFIISFIKFTPYLLYSYFTWLRKYSRHPESAPIEVRYEKVRKMMFKALHILRYDIKANNLDYFTKHEGSFLGISNHRSFFDPVFYIYYSEKPISFIAKKETGKIPFLSSVLRAIDAFLIDREDVMSQLRLFKEISERLKSNKISYLVFAEGGRMKDSSQIQTLPYKDGSLKPAYWAEKDIIFASIYGSHLVTERKPKGYTKRNITLEFHKPIKFSDIKDQSTTQVMPMIEKITNETLVKIAKENDSRNLK